jgi:ABC-2 type transport system permease protein
MSAERSIFWFAAFEMRLAWREVSSMLTGGKPGRLWRAIMAIAAIALLLHMLAFLVLQAVGSNIRADLATLIGVTAGIFLSGTAMLSQAMESVTRTFYTRSDLELILTAPVNAGKVFAVRIAAMAFSAGVMSLLLIGPFVDILLLRSGPRWLGAYGVLVAVSLTATALAVVVTILMFRLIGPKRTRLASQIVAAIVSGIFVIGLQIGAMFSTGTMSRFAFLRSKTVLNHAPALSSVLWLPARAALGDGHALLIVLGASIVFTLAVIVIFAPRFGGYVLTASSLSHGETRKPANERAFRPQSVASALRRKERVLLLRDPWLLSQSLMQILYLMPPALLLWRNFGSNGSATAIVVPVLIMAAGQLAGGLAWLTISGEDAPDLVMSAPVTPLGLLRAKVEAVLQCIAVIFLPLTIALAFASPMRAALAAFGIVAAASSSTAIQLWFRSQAKRSNFRRRHTSSRIATIAEALVSVTWAAAGAVAAMGSWIGLPIAFAAVVALIAVRAFSPSRSTRMSISRINQIDPGISSMHR